MKSEWFESWFDSPYYHLLYQHRDHHEAEAFMQRLTAYLLLEPKDTILDLGCGKGRHAIFLNSLGYSVTGVDLSIKNIELAKKYENDSLIFSTGDMRALDLNVQFKVILNLFTSFGYFEKQEDNVRVISNMKNHLVENGWLVIDYLNSSHFEMDQSKQREIEIENIVFRTNKSIENNSVRKIIEVDDAGQLHHFSETVRLLDLAWFEHALRLNNFEIQDIFGDYTLAKYDPKHSDRLIIIAKKITKV